MLNDAKSREGKPAARGAHPHDIRPVLVPPSGSRPPAEQDRHRGGAGVNALTHSLAAGNAKYGIRVNAIMPGLIETPMAIESISKARGIAKQDLIEARNQQVPLGRRMGTAWDVANAALFLASEEAGFITGAVLPVDGGQSARIG